MRNRKLLKKGMAILMTLVAVFMCAGGVTQAYAAHCNNDPYIFLHGDGKIFRQNEDGTSTGLYDDAEYTQILLQKAAPLAPKAFLTGDWTEWSEVAFAELSKAYDGIRPNPDGTLPENSGINWSWSPATVSSVHGYGLWSAFEYWPDSRLSPMDVASDFNDFVQAVKAKTGHDKVHLIARCEGSTFALAYLYLYAIPNNCADLASLTFSNSAAMGLPAAEAAMTGNVVLSDKTLYRYMRDGSVSNVPLDDEVTNVLRTVYNALRDTLAMDLTVAQANKIYQGIKDVFMARLIRDYYGRCLGYVSTVNEGYEQFKEYVFYEEGDSETFANIIAKADDFHYNVQVHTQELIMNVRDRGIPVNVIVEYGFQQYPFSEEANYVGDYMASVRKQSFGAVGSKMEEKLSDDYIRERTDAGFGKYISADKQIDASTAMLPDNTWFVKNSNHSFAGPIQDMVAKLLATPGATVDTLPGYSQFMNFVDENTPLQPLQEVNANDADYTPTQSQVEAGSSIIQKMVEFARKLFDKLMTIVQKIVNIFT